MIQESAAFQAATHELVTNAGGPRSSYSARSLGTRVGIRVLRNGPAVCGPESSARVVEKCPPSGDQSCYFEGFGMRWIMVASYARVGVGVEVTARRWGISSCLLAVY